MNRRDRSERGQTMTEVAGLLAVVALIVGAIAVLDVPAAVGSGIHTAVCTILNTPCGKAPAPGGGAPGAGAATPPGGPRGQDPSAPTSGPAIGPGLPIPVLPYNGETVSVSGTASSGNPESGGGGETGTSGPEAGAGAGADGGAEGSFKIQGKITATDSRGNPTLSSNCTETQQLAVSVDLQVSVQAGASKEGAGANVTGTKGVSATYQLNVTPQQVQSIQNGTMGAPNPLDPRTIPTGDSIVLNENSYKQLDLNGSYKGLSADLGYQQGHQVSSGIKALGGGVVQVDVGDAQLVQNALTLGVGNGDIGASFGSNDTFTNGKLRQIDINVNTPQGWAAYQQFLHTGVLPKSSQPGVSAPATQQVVTDTSQVKAEAHLFGLSAGFASNPSALNVTETDNADGSKTNTFNYRDGDVTEVATWNTSPGGATSAGTYQLLLHNATPQTLSNYAQMMGQQAGHYGSNQDLVLNFSPQQLDNLQQMAFEQLASYTKTYGPKPMSADEVRQYLAQNPQAALWGMWNGTATGIPLGALATAKNPGEILQAIQNAAHGSADGALYALGQLNVTTAEAQHPGIHNIVPYLHPLNGQQVCGRAR